MNKQDNEKKMLILTGRPLGFLGGTNSDIFYEIEQLVGRGYDVWVMCPESTDDNLVVSENICIINPDDKKYKFLPGPFFRMTYALHRAFLVRKLDKKEKFRYIHTHGVFAALASILACRRKKTILHLHSISSKDRFVMSRPFSAMSPWQKIIHSIVYVLTCILEILVYNAVKLILCVSEWEQRDALRKGFLNKGNIHLLRNGIDTDKFKPRPESRDNLRKKYISNDDSRICLFLGRLVPKNGPLIIAWAIPAVRQSLPDTTLIFAGDGIERDEIEKYIHNTGLEKILLTGAIPAEDILPVGDIFISHVSSLVEGHGQTILEAMSSGIPTITGRDGIKETVFNEDEIILIDKDDPKAIAEAVIRLVKDEKLRNSLASKGREKVVKEFSIDKQYDMFEDMLKSI